MIILFSYSIFRIVYQINPGICNGCGQCMIECPLEAIFFDEEIGSLRINPEICDGCGLCLNICPYGAIYEEDGRVVIKGTVLNSNGGFLLRNATIQADTVSTLSGMFGNYFLTLDPGIYDIICTAENFADSVINDVELSEYDVVEINFSLIPQIQISSNVLPESEIKLICFPNPINLSGKNRNDKATFNCFIPESGFSEISIYNIRGQKIKTLVNKVLETGNHKLIWNGKNDREKIVSAGLYIIEIKTDKYSKLKKFLIMK